MQVIEDKGIVLKKTIYQDNKLMVTFFTHQHGLINASVSFGKKQLFKLGCLEIGQIVRLEFLQSRHHFKLKDISLESFSKTLRNSLENMNSFLLLCQKLSYILPEGQALPVFFIFLCNALKAFDFIDCKKTWSAFIFFKWLQSEGLFHIAASPKALQSEISFFLTIKRFEEMKPMTRELQAFIESELMIHE